MINFNIYYSKLYFFIFNGNIIVCNNIDLVIYGFYVIMVIDFIEYYKFYEKKW